MAEPINQVHEQLWIANIDGARRVEKSQFDAVITVCQDSIEENVPDDIAYYHFNMADGQSVADIYGGRFDYEFFEQAASAIESHLENGDSILCHCHNGVSRSVSTSIAALSSYEDTTYNEMYNQVKQSRGQIHPDNMLREHAKQYIGEQ